MTAPPSSTPVANGANIVDKSAVFVAADATAVDVVIAVPNSAEMLVRTARRSSALGFSVRRTVCMSSSSVW
jgi:hypothetical protein